MNTHLPDLQGKTATTNSPLNSSQRLLFSEPYICGGMTYIILCNIWVIVSLGAGKVEWATVVVIVCVHKPSDMV